MSLEDEVRELQVQRAETLAQELDGVARLQLAVDEFFEVVREAEALLRRHGQPLLPIFQFQNGRGGLRDRYSGRRGYFVEGYLVIANGELFSGDSYIYSRATENIRGSEAGLRPGNPYILLSSSRAMRSDPHAFRLADHNREAGSDSFSEGDLMMTVSAHNNDWTEVARRYLARSLAKTLDT